MKAVVGYLVGAIIAAAVGALFLSVGMLDRQMVRGEQSVVTGDYDESARVFSQAEVYYERASHIPWVGDGAHNEVLAREAALQYWQRRYGTMGLTASDPIASLPADNVDLQLLVANAVYRDGIQRAKDRTTTIAALDASISAYFSVLKNASRQHDASYNYEYVVKLRDDLEQGRRKAPPPPEEEELHGHAAHSPDQQDVSKFKVYVPKAQEEIQKNDAAAAAGKAAPIKRKG